jgi:hypothetical protein
MGCIRCPYHGETVIAFVSHDVALSILNERQAQSEIEKLILHADKTFQSTHDVDRTSLAQWREEGLIPESSNRVISEMDSLEIFSRLHPICGCCLQVSRLGYMTNSIAFKRAFPNAKVLLTLEDIQAARESELPEDYVPFMLEQQPRHIDYYAFDINDNKRRVIVFAEHAVVHDWPDFNAFLSWVNQQMIGVKQ